MIGESVVTRLRNTQYSKENRNEALLRRWPSVAGYPHLFVLDAGGGLVHSQDTSELEAGDGYDRNRVLGFLDRWSRAPEAPKRD